MTPAATTILGVPILTFLTFFPTVGALALLFLPSARPGLIRWFAFLVSGATFLASIPAEPGSVVLVAQTQEEAEARARRWAESLR